MRAKKLKLQPLRKAQRGFCPGGLLQESSGIRAVCGGQFQTPEQ